MKHIDVSRELANERPYGHYTMTLRNKHGNIIQEGTYQLHSLIYQHWELLYNTITSDGNSSYTRIDGLANQSMNNLQVSAGGSGGTTDTRGIVVGTSSTTVSLGNEALGGFIQTGTAANELSYSASVVTYDASNGRITLSRTFTNNAVSTEPTVNCVGIAVDDGSSELGNLLLVRDVPGSSYVMLLDAVLTVSYELTWPFGCQNFGMLFAKHQIARNTTNLELYNATGTLVTGASYGISDGAFGFVASIGDTTRGVIVGNASNAESFNTFALGTKIGHGINAGELFHYDSTVSSFEWSNIDNSAGFYLSRAFKNKSGSAVNIAEVGLSSNATIGSTNFAYLFDRRVLSPEVEIADNETVTVTWAIKYNFT